MTGCFSFQGLSVTHLTRGVYPMNLNFLYLVHSTSVFVYSTLRMLVALWRYGSLLDHCQKTSQAGTLIIGHTVET